MTTILSHEFCQFYLWNVFQSPLDKKHNIRLAIGSGLRTDIWRQFEKRYNIPWIIEYFGTTEGTAALMNLENRLGSCGRLSPFLVCFGWFGKLVTYNTRRILWGICHVIEVRFLKYFNPSSEIFCTKTEVFGLLFNQLFNYTDY